MREVGSARGGFPVTIDGALQDLDVLGGQEGAVDEAERGSIREEDDRLPTVRDRLDLARPLRHEVEDPPVDARSLGEVDHRQPGRRVVGPSHQ